MKKILITGATGFVGGRLAEIAAERGIHVVALVRDWSRAARLSRLKIEMAQGDVLKAASLQSAMKECDAVFHCAVDNRASGTPHRQSSADGARNVMQAALESRVRSVIHLSSIAVYGYKLVSDVNNEQHVCRYTGDAYCDGKIDAEQTALYYAQRHALPVTVLRPTIVYGPFGAWTIDTVKAIRAGSMIMANGGSGICNTLYVDNLALAMLDAAETNRGAGQVFHISDSHTVSWKEFAESHARPLGSQYLPLPAMSSDEIQAARDRAQANSPASLQQLKQIATNFDLINSVRAVPAISRVEHVSRSIARAVLPQTTRSSLRASLTASLGAPGGQRNPAKTPPLPSPSQVDLQSTNVVFSIDKATRTFGYDPKIDFNEGMRRTAAWIRWARL